MEGYGKGEGEGVRFSVLVQSQQDLDRVVVHAPDAQIAIFVPNEQAGKEGSGETIGGEDKEEEEEIELLSFESHDSALEAVTVRALLGRAITDIETNRHMLLNSAPSHGGGGKDPQEKITELLERLASLQKLGDEEEEEEQRSGGPGAADRSFRLHIRCPEGTTTVDGIDEDCVTRFRRTQAENARLGILNLGHPVLSHGERSASGVAEHLRRLGVPKLVVLLGAGVSVNAGISPFRGAPDAVYNNVQKEYSELEKPEDLFSIDFFRKNPQPYYDFRSKMWDKEPQPTDTHHALAELVQRGLVVKIFTQNIDSLEHKAGCPPEKCVQVHGNIDTARCDACQLPVTMELLRSASVAGSIPHCTACGGVARPNVVMFGESIPDLDTRILENCDAMLIIGTSLLVPPINELHRAVPHDCLRVFINKDPPPPDAGFDFSGLDGRDVFLQGDCDEVIAQLAL